MPLEKEFVTKKFDIHNLFSHLQLIIFIKLIIMNLCNKIIMILSL